MRGAGQRDVAFAGKKAGCWVKTDPARARNVDLGPCMQIGKICFRTGGPVQRFFISRELNQIATDKSSSQAPQTENLHQQPGRITAGTECQLQGFFTALHARLHTDGIVDGFVELLININQEIDRSFFTAVGIVQPLFQ